MITSHLPEVRLELIAPSQLCTDVDSTVLEHSGPDLPTPRQCAQNYRAQLNQLKRAGDLVIPERTVSLPEAAPPRPWFPLEWMSNLFAPQSPVSTPGEHNQVGPPAGVSFEEVTPINVWTEDPDFMTKIENLPYLQTFLQMSSNHPAPEPAVLEEEAVEPKVKTHFAVENVVALVDTFVEQCQDKDTREIFSYEHGKTNLAQTDDLVVQLFPHQQNKDDAFHKITVASRLVFSDPATNQRDIQRPETRTAGHELWLAFHRRMKLPSTKVPFSPELWEHATDHVERTYLSKSQANLENGRQRQDPDMPDPKIDLFIKSQWVKKLEKLGHTFKAGQTVSSFKQESIRRTAILATYMRLATEKFQPAHIFVNVRKTPADLARWVKENWNFTVDSDENDYTQFDKSQDEVTTVFEDLYHAHFSIPVDDRDFYLFMKGNAYCYAGHLGFCRTSGEGGTFWYNTCVNIAFDYLFNDFPLDTPGLYGGDDMARNLPAQLRASRSALRQSFKLKAKTVTKRYPGFCGWTLLPCGPIKNPTQFYMALLLGEKLGRIADILPNYTIDLNPAYRAGDALHEYLTPEELAFHHASLRTLLKHGVQFHDELDDHYPVYEITSDRFLAKLSGSR